MGGFFSIRVVLGLWLCAAREAYLKPLSSFRNVSRLPMEVMEASMSPLFALSPLRWVLNTLTKKNFAWFEKNQASSCCKGLILMLDHGDMVCCKLSAMWQALVEEKKRKEREAPLAAPAAPKPSTLSGALTAMWHAQIEAKKRKEREALLAAPAHPNPLP